MDTQDDVTASLDALPTQLAPPSAEEQAEQFFKVFIEKNSDQVVGSTVVPVPYKWMNNYKRFVKGNASTPPGIISFASLLNKKGVVDLTTGAFIVFVNKEAFELLRQWYGVQDPEHLKWIPVVAGDDGKPLIETVPLTFRAVAVAKQSDLVDIAKDVKCSRAETVGDLKTKILETFDVSPNVDTRLWSYQNSDWYSEYKDDDLLVGQANMVVSSKLVLEYRSSADEPWVSETGKTANSSDDEALPAVDIGSGSGGSNNNNNITRTYGSGASSTNNYNNTSSTTYNSSYKSPTTYSPYSSSTYSSTYSSRKPGETGLRNLGNTCFMNSALQCLSHCQDLADYFLEQDWRRDINADNPIGQGGRMAEAFADLLRKLWSGAHRDVSPYDLKGLIARVAPQFSGYQQHDSQELTTFLLDSLHEDLNRVLKKPFVEQKEAEGDDVTAAQEAWERFSLRNASQLVDLFFGQYKSTLVCPDCDKVSVTFDPMMYLSVPIPELTTMVVDVRFIPADKSLQHTELGIEVLAKSGTIQDLLLQVADHMDVPLNELVATDYLNSTFWKIFHESESTGNINPGTDKIYVYHVPSNEAADPIISVILYPSTPAYQSSYYAYSRRNNDPFGFPFFIRAPKDATEDDLRKLIDVQLSPFIAQPWTATTDADNHDADKDDDDSDAELEQAYQEQQGGAAMDQQDGAAMDQTPEPTIVSTEAALDYTIEVSQYERSDVRCIHDFENNEPYTCTDTQKECIALFFADDEKSRYASVGVDDAIMHESTAKLKRRSKKVDKQVQLDDCIRQFTTPEVLSDDNKWYCPQCKEHRQAKKQLEIWRLPQNLIVHLKRFSYTEHYRDKIDTRVEFPLTELDLSPYVLSPEDKQGAIYDLFAVSNHMGNFGGGHYTAYAVDKAGNWCNYDDSWVSSAQEDQLVSTSSYMLFYRRRSDPSVPAVVKPGEAEMAEQVVGKDDDDQAMQETDDGFDDDEDAPPSYDSTHRDVENALD
eukprot:m.10819 g.10819  ORF g.10819 m.10819 type:complete len:989 (-) comp9682_c1_seq1:271-3237(-)